MGKIRVSVLFEDVPNHCSKADCLKQCGLDALGRVFVDILGVDCSGPLTLARRVWRGRRTTKTHRPTSARPNRPSLPGVVLNFVERRTYDGRMQGMEGSDNTNAKRNIVGEKGERKQRPQQEGNVELEEWQTPTPLELVET